MTPRKKWPHRADWARMDCISLARSGRKTLEGEVERIQEIGLLRAVSRAMETFRDIECRLTECKNEEPEK